MKNENQRSVKKNEEKYDKVDVLPKGAMTVKEYLEANKLKDNTFYMQVQRHKKRREENPAYKPPFRVVVFHTINFVVPNLKVAKT